MKRRNFLCATALAPLACLNLGAKHNVCNANVSDVILDDDSHDIEKLTAEWKKFFVTEKFCVNTLLKRCATTRNEHIALLTGKNHAN